MNWKKWFSPKAADENLVYWGFDAERIPTLGGLALTSLPPESALKHYYRNNSSWFMKCPAFTSHLQNTFIIRSPIDVEVTYNRANPEKREMNVVKPAGTPGVKKDILEPRFREVHGENAHELFSLKITPYMFWSKQSVMMEIIHPFLEWNNPNRVRVISGHFNIGKWVREIEYAIEVEEKVGTLKIKRGDPLFYVRFTAENAHTKLRLKEAAITPELRQEFKENAILKTVMTKCPMETVYELRRSLNERRAGYNK